MRWQFHTLTAAMLVVAGTIAASAQQAPGTLVPDGERQSQKGERTPQSGYFDDESDDWDDRRGSSMMERRPNRGPAWRRHPGAATGTMAFEMMGPGMGGPGMVRMMMILMDSDGDGAVSLQEFQAGHERMFKAMDADKDGRLTLEEVQRFGRSLASPPLQR